MINPVKNDIGRNVTYMGNYVNNGKPEWGVVTSFNDDYVFVQYEGESNSKATKREDLIWGRYNLAHGLPNT